MNMYVTITKNLMILDKHIHTDINELQTNLIHLNMKVGEQEEITSNNLGI